MNIIDLHTHTKFSDGDATVEDIIQVANKKGYKVGISDHAFCTKMTTMKSIEDYLEKLERYNVYKGVESNIGDYTKWSDKVVSKLDYVIASVHTFEQDGERVWLSPYFGYRSGHKSTYNKQYKSIDSRYFLEETLKLIENTLKRTRVDILGHSTVLPFYEDLKDTTYIQQWEDAVLTLCEKYNVAVEISGLWKEPGENYIKKAMEKGLMFSVGSDCHKLNEICNLEYPIKLINQLQISESQMFKI